MESLLVLQSLLSLDGVFADGDFVELEIFRHFLCGHDVCHRQILRRKICSYDCFKTVNDEYF
jgi:hypothetical protein